MSVDKTIISIPSLYFYQYAPNTAGNLSQLTYNEGIYIDASSIGKTYAKSVVRVYKNKNNPKKIYLLAKDTTMLDAVSDAYSVLPSGYAAKDIVKNFPTINRHIDLSDNNLSKYSKFSQPSTFISLNFDNLIDKTINFYCLNSSSVENIGNALGGEFSSGTPAGSTMPGNFTDIENSTQILVSYYLKSKSIVADYINTPDSFTEDQLNIFNGALYYYWFDKEATINSLKTLTTNDITLYKSSKIKKTKQIDFSQYIDKKYESVWVQKIDSQVEDSGAGQNYVIAEEDLEQSEDSSKRWFPLYSYMQNEESAGTTYFSDGTEFDYMVDKFMFIQKNDFTITYQAYERELFSLSQTRPFGLYERTIEGDGATGAFDYIGSLNKVQADIFELENQIFVPDKAWIKEYYSDDAVKSPLNYLQSSKDRIDQFTDGDFSRDRHLSNFYILNDLYEQDKHELGQLFPDNPESTIVYEIQLDEELDIDNGAFMVVEIE